MAASPIRKARFPEEYDREFVRLQQRLNLENVHGSDSKTLQAAVVLANKHLDLKAKIKDFMRENFGGWL